MNERLKFSWSHIIAFIAIIVVSYVSFVGFTYLTNGNFTFALIGMGITDIVYIIVFIGAQQLKASLTKMHRKIILERILIFGSPLIFVMGMISMAHAWTIWSQQEKIISQFNSSINNSKQLFDDYENYSDLRIENYDKMLKMFIASPDQYRTKFREAGLNPEKAQIQRENMVETLKLQLRSENYDSLKNSALKWIDDANKGKSTWNVFIIGNTQVIKEALSNWENQLKTFSSKEMSNEALLGEVPKFSSNGVKVAIQGIDAMTSTFTTLQFPTLWAIIFGIMIYLMLLFPYFLQCRPAKNVNRLVGKKDDRKSKISINNSEELNKPRRGTFRLN